MTGYQSKKAAALDKLDDDDTQMYGDALTIAYQSGYHDGKKAAQPAQEPVCPECKAGVLYECVACSSNNYPPQRPWVDLTPEEILDLFDSKNVYGSKWVEFARAVEAKLREKNT